MATARDRKAGEAKNRHVGRKAVKRYTPGTQPGQVFLLALASAAPIVFLFILGPLLRPGGFAIQEFPVWRALFLAGTPALALAALVRFARAPEWARAHPAARAGRFLSFANLLLWLVYGGLYVWLFVIRGGPGAA